MIYVCYIYIYIYIWIYICVWVCVEYLASHFCAISPEIYRVGDNRRTVNTSTTPYISDQSGTENACKTQLGRFIVMIWVLACNNMYRYERHLGYFYDNPTILETVSILASKYVNGPFFIEIQRQGIILAPMCLCQGKMWKSHVKNIFHIPRWPVRVKSNYVILRGVSLVAQSLTTTCPQPAVGAAKHHRQNAYLTTMFGHYVQGYFNN